MKNSINYYLSILVILFFWGCQPSQKTSNSDDGQIEITILQINDVYEIGTLEGGKAGGMARVAQIEKDLLVKNPNTFSVIAGDFLNPSVIGTLKYQGERIKGKQMIETLNVAGIDLATFGNHEFDLNEEELLKRVDESEFDWTISNVLHKKDGQLLPFQHKGKDIPNYWIKEFKDKDGTAVKVAVISNCLNVNNPDYVHYDDPFLKFKEAYLEAKEKADIVIGLTHQTIEDDKKLAAQLPEIPLIMGGHEHHNMKHEVGNVIITKADANAKTVYIHTLKFNKNKKSLQLKSNLKKIDESVSKEPKTEAVVQKWTKIAYHVLEESGINPEKSIITLKKPINATEQIVRHRPSVIGKIVTNSIALAYPEADASIVNTGSIRIDDMIEGDITQFDIVRILPYGGSIQMATMKGSLLIKVLQVGQSNVGEGGYLAWSDDLGYNADENIYTINNMPIEGGKMYKVAMPGFLLLGLEQNLEFLKSTNPDISKVVDATTDEQKDVRVAVIEFLKKGIVPKL